MAGLNDVPGLQALAVPAVCSLIAFLAYFPQYLLRYSSLEPGPPSRRETSLFNALVLLLWYTYFKTVTEDAGRFVFSDAVMEVEGNWCDRCSAPKPARAHHCRHCGRCIPKMDHHCPWTTNCVSMTTFPHFLRFLVFSNLSLWMLANLLWQRFAALWEARHLPAFLGPTLPALVGLTMCALVCLVASLALAIMLITTTKNWLYNCTTIEGWQLERHEAMLERGGRDWWGLHDADGKKVRIERVEFPYDLGFFTNMSQAMGTSNVILWLLPFCPGPKVGENGTGTGWDWEENGFNRKKGMWPPVDPDKAQRANRVWPAARRDFAAELRHVEATVEDHKRMLRERQRREAEQDTLAELDQVDGYDSADEHDQLGNFEDIAAWRNTDGETLRDYGVDEDAERYVSQTPSEDDDIPISELIRRRRTMRYEDVKLPS
ncbi:hypothetical protein E4U42_000597 [Claviceps africana]|uniref:Palmitoyltransferase PFA4 n=1 Tax=Claviceps africana TaxID=83212 RepID=A0A8K0NID5_9HYPO|nr:hypothetical protein E4U42_000597 [Claviceps africana]